MNIESARAKQPTQMRVEAEKQIPLAASKAARLIEARRPSPDVFQDLYGADNIEKDQQLVERMKGRFEHIDTADGRNSELLAIAFEGLLIDRVSKGIFGQRVTMSPTAEFDDVINGVDAVVEITGARTENLGLAIDATFSPDVRKKFSEIFSRIQAGQLATIKYFHSEAVGIRGEFKVPLFVLGMSADNILPLLESWNGGQEDVLQNNPYPLVLLKELAEQATVFGAFARKHGKDILAKRYNKIRDTCEDLRSERRRELGVAILPQNLQQDNVAKAISQALAQLTG